MIPILAILFSSNDDVWPGGVRPSTWPILASFYTPYFAFPALIFYHELLGWYQREIATPKIKTKGL
jgi:hypothetical protein